jgi:hypothetical protein
MKKRVIKKVLDEVFGLDTSNMTKITEVIITYHILDLKNLLADAKLFGGERGDRKSIHDENMIEFDFTNEKNAAKFINYVDDHYDVIDIKELSAYK